MQNPGKMPGFFWQKEIIKEFDEDLFTALVEQIRGVSLVEVVFALKAGVEVREVVWCRLNKKDGEKPKNLLIFVRNIIKLYK